MAQRIRKHLTADNLVIALLHAFLGIPLLTTSRAVFNWSFCIFLIASGASVGWCIWRHREETKRRLQGLSFLKLAEDYRELYRVVFVLGIIPIYLSLAWASSPSLNATTTVMPEFPTTQLLLRLSVGLFAAWALLAWPLTYIVWRNLPKWFRRLLELLSPPVTRETGERSETSSSTEPVLLTPASERASR